MINVRCVGHIATAMGSSELEVEGDDIEAAELIERLRTMSGKAEPGFTKFNTLVVVEDGEAYVSASGDRRVKAGDSVVLIPFSHGG